MYDYATVSRSVIMKMSKIFVHVQSAIIGRYKSISLAVCALLTSIQCGMCLSGDDDGGCDVDCSKPRLLHHNLRLAALCRLPISRRVKVLCAVLGRSPVQLSSASTCPSVYLCVCLYVRLSVCLYVHANYCPSVCVTVFAMQSHSQWRINLEAMEARASGPQFLGQKIGPAFRLISNI